MSKERHWRIYVITHVPTGKQYVGVTRDPGRRWREHQAAANNGVRTALAGAIRKYGNSEFSFAEIACSSNWADACEAEKALILQLGTKAPRGFNLTDGGDGAGGLPDDIRERIAAALRGRKMDPEAVARRALAQRGVARSAAHRAAISAANKGKALSEEHRAKMSAAHKGKKQAPRTAEHSAKIAEGLRAAWARRKQAGLAR